MVFPFCEAAMAALRREVGCEQEINLRTHLLALLRHWPWRRAAAVVVVVVLSRVAASAGWG